MDPGSSLVCGSGKRHLSPATIDHHTRSQDGSILSLAETTHPVIRAAQSVQIDRCIGSCFVSDVYSIAIC